MTRLIGMVHLGPLPGSPRYGGDLAVVLEAAVADATTLAQAGFDGLMVENFGDDPFHPDRVPPVTVAALTRAVADIHAQVALPVGVNVLRNDGPAAVAVAAATGASFIRVNVLSGVMFTDQGMIQGRAAEVARLRAALAPHLEVMADVFVKHAVPPAGLTIEQAAADLYERGGADTLVVSGPATGRQPDPSVLARVRRALPEAPLLIGSGANRSNLAALLEHADGVIVGTSIKQGSASDPVDRRLATDLVAAARAVARDIPA